jgi:hypothetical protein
VVFRPTRAVGAAGGNATAARGRYTVRMENATAAPIDKSTWGAGPWQDEPDRVDFVAHGFACLALRHPNCGHWCGYVGVPREHPAYGKGYDDLYFEVHGGLTYAHVCDRMICHVPAPGMPEDVWWLGFDFAHGFDLSPGMEARERELARTSRERGLIKTAELFEREIPAEMRGVYRALPYVRSEIESLAQQLRRRADDAQP